MIELNNVTYRYPRGAEALCGISARIGRGIHLLLGENGAGKTTLLHIIAGLRRPRTGSCIVFDEDPSRRMPYTLSSTFIVDDEMTIPARTVDEFSRIHAVFYPTFSRSVLDDCLTQFGLTGSEPLAALSLGNRKKSLLAYALALRTPLLLLDEPANGLDINARKVLRRIMSQYVDDSQCVIVSTHSVVELGPLYESVIVLTRSRMLLNAYTSTVLEKVSFTVGGDVPQDALYAERDLGIVHAIVPNHSGEAVTDIDFALLYSALLSSESKALLQQLNS